LRPGAFYGIIEAEQEGAPKHLQSVSRGWDQKEALGSYKERGLL